MKKKCYKKYFINILLSLQVIFLCALFFFSRQTSAQGDAKDFFEILVKMKNNSEVYAVRVEENINPQEIIGAYRQREDVEFVERNYEFSAAAFPNDPFFTKQWYLDSIQAKEAWSDELLIKEARKVNRESVIAILDTGVKIDHPDLKDNIWINTQEIAGDGIDNDRNGYIDDMNGWDFIANTANPDPKFNEGYVKNAVSHGTIVAGIAAAVGHNNEGIAGISWHAKIMPLRVLDGKGDGNVLNVYKAIQYAINNKVDVINMSFVGDEESDILSEVIKSAYKAGIVVVAAAGNSNPNESGIDFQKSERFPICSAQSDKENYILGVAALDKQSKRSVFSNYGSNCVDISAPGEDIFGVDVYNPSITGFSANYNGPWSGTSLSAPMVTGAVALIKSIRPDLSVEQLELAIIKGAMKLENSERNGLGRGKLNIKESLKLALQFKPGEGANLEAEQHFIVATLGLGSFPQLKVLKKDGSIFKSFFPFNPNFKGPINVAVGNIDDDTSEEIVTAAGFGGGPHVRIFDIEGRLKGQFFAYDKNKRSGVNIALGDIDGDGIFEIITGPGKGMKPEVKIFNREGKLLSSFLAYNEKFLGGVNVSAGDINGDGVDEIVSGPGLGGGPHVRVFNKDGTVIQQFFAFNAESRSGVRVAVGDMNNDVFDEIITSVEGAASPLVRVYRTTDFSYISEFFAFSPDFLKGVYLAVGDYDTDGINEIIAGAGIGGPPYIRIFDLLGNVKKQMTVHLDSYIGGARVGVMKYK